MHKKVVARQTSALAHDLMEVTEDMELDLNKTEPTGTPLVAFQPSYRGRLGYISSRLFGLIEYMDKHSVW